jgi:hypothetical protein
MIRRTFLTFPAGSFAELVGAIAAKVRTQRTAFGIFIIRYGLTTRLVTYFFSVKIACSFARRRRLPPSKEA